MESNKHGQKRPNPEEILYGIDQYKLGYDAGYRRALLDIRKIKANRERCLMDRFKTYADYVEDIFATNRKR